jgi:hypothetical protein
LFFFAIQKIKFKATRVGDTRARPLISLSLSLSHAHSLSLRVSQSQSYARREKRCAAQTKEREKGEHDAPRKDVIKSALTTLS